MSCYKTKNINRKNKREKDRRKRLHKRQRQEARLNDQQEGRAGMAGTEAGLEAAPDLYAFVAGQICKTNSRAFKIERRHRSPRTIPHQTPSEGERQAHEGET